MPILTGRSGHIDFPLSDYAIGAFNEGFTGDGFIAGDLLPEIPVDFQSNLFYTLDKRAFMTDPGQAALRAPRTQARRIEYSVSTDSYYCFNYALASDFGLDEVANLDTLLKGMQRTRLVVGNLRRAQEIRVANLLTSISNVGSGVALSGTNKWSDLTNSNPIADITTGQAFIQKATGFVPNVLAVDWNTFQVLRQHPVFLDMFKYTAGGAATADQVASALGLEKIMIAKSVKENQLEGAAATSMTSIWGNSALLAYLPPTGSSTFEMPGAGAVRFAWNNNGVYPGQFGVLRSTEDWAGSRHIETIEAGHYQSEKVVARDFMYAYTGTL